MALGGEDGLTVQGLLSNGYEAVFVGIGLPDPKVVPMFQGLTITNGFYTSKDFLPVVCSASKPGTSKLTANIGHHNNRIMHNDLSIYPYRHVFLLQDSPTQAAWYSYRPWCWGHCV